MTHFTKNDAFEAYEAPVCEVFAAAMQSVLCVSFENDGGIDNGRGEEWPNI